MRAAVCAGVGVLDSESGGLGLGSGILVEMVYRVGVDGVRFRACGLGIRIQGSGYRVKGEGDHTFCRAEVHGCVFSWIRKQG